MRMLHFIMFALAAEEEIVEELKICMSSLNKI